MALSSFLTSGHKPIDTELDALFTAKPASEPPVQKPKQKRKLAGDTETRETKRSKVDKPPVPVKEKKKEKKGKQKVAEVDQLAESSKSAAQKSAKRSKASKKKVEPSPDATLDSEDEEEEANAADAVDAKPASLDDSDSDYSDSDSEGDPSNLVHESLSGSKTSSSTVKIKYVPEDESPAQRDARTIFVGNLSVQVAQKRVLQRQLRRHILDRVPKARIESIRFRSVPYQNPTSQVPDDPSTSSPSKKSSNPKTPSKHDLERAASWRAKDKDAAEVEKDKKKFLTPNEKKKIAFINREFHATADTIHAYIVFSHPVPRAANLPPLEVLDPYEAARKAAEACDGSDFMSRLLRVDVVGKGDAGEMSRLGLDADTKLSVFVGNLDFATKEEDLRLFFEGVVTTERGEPPEGQRWVKRVRLVRDKETQLGKGFAYVQLTDRGCVDELVALEEDKLKLAKRKLRVQRCKALPSSNKSSGTSKPAKSPRPSQPTSTQLYAQVPKGNPAFGSQIAHLSKEERKEAKATDAERVARRLAKKKARHALGLERKNENEKRKERKRTSSSHNSKKRKKAALKESKARVRSEKALEKLNPKK